MLRVEAGLKGDQLHTFDKVNVRTIYLRDVLLLCDAPEEVIPLDVDDTEDAIEHELLAHALVLVGVIGLLANLAELLIYHQDFLLLAI